MHIRNAFANNIGKTEFSKGETMKKNLFGTLGQYIKGNAVIIVLAVATVAAGVLSFNTIKDINDRLDNQGLQPPTEVEQTQPAEESQQTEDVDKPAENVPLKPKATAKPAVTAKPQTEEVTEETVTEAEGVEIKEENTAPFVLPVDGKIITAFSDDELVYNITMKDWRTHNGIDVKATKDTAVKASCDGTVKKIYNDGMLGWTVEIENGDFTTRYCGLGEKLFVKEGARVKQGDTIGKVGEIPLESATESHIHLEIIKNGNYQNPDEYLGR